MNREFKTVNYKRFDTKITPFTCLDTVNGFCDENISKQDCLEKCQNEELCNVGYWRSNDDNKQNSLGTCYSYNKDILDQTNPYYFMQPSNKGSSVFIDGERHSFPPKDVRYIYSHDVFYLQDMNGGIVDNSSIDDPGVMFGDGVGTPIKIYSVYPTYKYLHNRDTFVPPNSFKIKNYSFVLMSIDDTFIVMTRINSNTLSPTDFLFNTQYIRWYPGLIRNQMLSGDTSNCIQLICRDKGRDEFLEYGDNIIMKYGGFQELFVDHEMLYFSNNVLKNPYYFKMKSQVDVSYCDGKRCVKDKMSNVDKDKKIYRVGNCFELC